MLRDVAMATNFGTQFAITGIVGYNCGCLIASDKLFDSRGRFSGSSYPIKTKIKYLRSLPWQPILGLILLLTALSGWPTECRYCRYHAPKGRCHGNHFLAFDGL